MVLIRFKLINKSIEFIILIKFLLILYLFFFKNKS